MKELTGLGEWLDRTPFKTQPPTPWAEEDFPHGETIDLDEYPVEVLKLKKCRSFRADLFHKLMIIVRACGGHGRGGVERAAQLLQVSRQTLNRWLRWENSPKTVQAFLRIDNRYAEALEKLVAKKLGRKKRIRKKK